MFSAKKIILLLSVIFLFSALFGFAKEEQKALIDMTKEELQEVAGTSPWSFWYPVDRAMEEFGRVFTGLRGAEVSVRYLKENLQERQAELMLYGSEDTELHMDIHDKRDPSGEGYSEALGDIVNILTELSNIFNRERSRLAELHKDEDEAVLHADYVYLSNLRKYEYADGSVKDVYDEVEIARQILYEERRSVFEQAKRVIREKLAEASKRDDVNEMEELLRQIGEIREDFAQKSMLHGKYGLAVELFRESTTWNRDLGSIQEAEDIILEAEAAKIQLNIKLDALRRQGDNYKLYYMRSINSFDLAPLDEIITKAQKYINDWQKRTAPIIGSNAKLQGLRQEMKKFVKNLDGKIEKIYTEVDEEQKTKAEKDAETAEAKKSQPPVQKPSLPPLGEPTGTASPQLMFVLNQTNFTAQVGEGFSYSFCEPALGSTSDLCTAAATNPEHGLPPYSFVIQTGGGFPPMGLNLNKNGLLTGTPTVEGSWTFGVCAVDQGGVSVCRTVTVNVAKKPVAKPNKLPCEVVFMQCHDACITSNGGWGEAANDCNNANCRPVKYACEDACNAERNSCYASCFGNSSCIDDCDLRHDYCMWLE